MKLFSKKPKKPLTANERLGKLKFTDLAGEQDESVAQHLLVQKPVNDEKTKDLTDCIIPPRERRVQKIKFRTLASDRPNKAVALNKEFEKAQLTLRTVFSPSSPVLDINYFAGRVKETTRAVSALENERMHLIIHGKRGLGKTSFSNTLCGIAREAGYIVCNTASSQHSTYSEIFRAFLKEIPLLYDQNFVTDHGVDTRLEGFDTLLPEGDFSPKELTKILLRLATTRVLFIIDEFDRNQSPDFKDAIIETIKNFSDGCVRASLIVIGATDTVDELIGVNESVRRNITGIPIKVFNDTESGELFDIGEEASNVVFPPHIRAEISNLSRNIPHSMRLLCLHSAQAALIQERWTITDKDMAQAISLSIMDAQALLDVDLLEITHSKKSNQFEAFLYSLASSECNENSEFYAEQAAQAHRKQNNEVVTALSIGSRMAMLCKTTPPILTKREHQHKVLYKFSDPTFGFYLRLMHSYGRILAQKEA